MVPQMQKADSANMSSGVLSSAVSGRWIHQVDAQLRTVLRWRVLFEGNIFLRGWGFPYQSGGCNSIHQTALPLFRSFFEGPLGSLTLPFPTSRRMCTSKSTDFPLGFLSRKHTPTGREVPRGATGWSLGRPVAGGTSSRE